MPQTEIKELLTILDESPVGVSISRRRDGVIVYANPRFIELVGMTPENFIGTSARTRFVNDEQRRSVIGQLKDLRHRPAQGSQRKNPAADKTL